MAAKQRDFQRMEAKAADRLAAAGHSNIGGTANRYYKEIAREQAKFGIKLYIDLAQELKVEVESDEDLEKMRKAGMALMEPYFRSMEDRDAKRFAMAGYGYTRGNASFIEKLKRDYGNQLYEKLLAQQQFDATGPESAGGQAAPKEVSAEELKYIVVLDLKDRRQS